MTSGIRARISGRHGFTLPEVMIAAFLTGIAILAIMTTYLLLIRNGINIAGYSEIETEVRRGFEQFGIDARMASGISTSSTTTAITLTVPNNYTGTGNLVTYGYDSTNQLFYLVPGDGVSTGQTYVAPGSGSPPAGQQILIGQMGNSKLTVKVTSVTFYRYDASATQTTTDSVAKHIQIGLNVQRAAAGGDTANENIMSAAFTMRNKL